MSWLDTLEQVRTRDYKKAKPEEREQACRDIVNTCSYAAAFVAVMPLPFTDVLLTLPIQSGMVLTVGHIHGRKLSGAQAKDLAMELGTLAGASLLARQGIKLLIPVFGAVMTVPAAFAANWAIGRVAMEYFKNPEVSKARLKQLYADAVREGKARFSRDEFERFRKEKGNEAAVKKVVKPKGKTAAKGKKATASKSRKARGPTVESILEEDSAAPHRRARGAREGGGQGDPRGALGARRRQLDARSRERTAQGEEGQARLAGDDRANHGGRLREAGLGRNRSRSGDDGRRAHPGAAGSRARAGVRSAHRVIGKGGTWRGGWRQRCSAGSWDAAPVGRMRTPEHRTPGRRMRARPTPAR